MAVFPWDVTSNQRYVEIALERLNRLVKGTLKTRPMGIPVYRHL